MKNIITFVKSRVYLSDKRKRIFHSEPLVYNFKYNNFGCLIHKSLLLLKEVKKGHSLEMPESDVVLLIHMSFFDTKSF